ncbi:UNVERIFIED_CONTAM: hypothetical protein FKN15_005364 [Acipenser sinensis]
MRDGERWGDWEQQHNPVSVRDLTMVVLGYLAADMGGMPSIEQEGEEQSLPSPVPEREEQGSPQPSPPAEEECLLSPSPPAEGKCLLFPYPPAEGECLLVLPPQPKQEAQKDKAGECWAGGPVSAHGRPDTVDDGQ